MCQVCRAQPAPWSQPPQCWLESLFIGHTPFNWSLHFQFLKKLKLILEHNESLLKIKCLNQHCGLLPFEGSFFLLHQTFLSVLWSILLPLCPRGSPLPFSHTPVISALNCCRWDYTARTVSCCVTVKRPVQISCSRCMGSPTSIPPGPQECPILFV